MSEHVPGALAAILTILLAIILIFYALHSILRLP